MFKDYPLDPMYQVSREGEVFSKFTNRKLKCGPNYHGYPVVNTRDASGKRTPTYVHRMVAITYIPKVIGKPYINHKDGDKTNNCVENLEWCTNHENLLHAKDNGMLMHGTAHVNAKLNDEIVHKICLCVVRGLSYGKVSRFLRMFFNVELSRASFLNIRARRTWKHVTCKYVWDKKNTANKLSGRVETISQESTPK